MSRGQHEPLRRCAACRTIRPKSEMIRIACPKDGEPAVDEAGRMPGRGAYLCPDSGCVETALKKGSLARALRAQIPAGTAEQLAAMTEGTDHA